MRVPRYSLPCILACNIFFVSFHVACIFYFSFHLFLPHGASIPTFMVTAVGGFSYNDFCSFSLFSDDDYFQIFVICAVFAQRLEIPYAIRFLDALKKRIGIRYPMICKKAFILELLVRFLKPLCQYTD